MQALLGSEVIRPGQSHRWLEPLAPMAPPLVDPPRPPKPGRVRAAVQNECQCPTALTGRSVGHSVGRSVGRHGVRGVPPFTLSTPADGSAETLFWKVGSKPMFETQ